MRSEFTKYEEDEAAKNRLLKVERFIVVYNKKWDAPLKGINIDNIPLPIFIAIPIAFGVVLPGTA